MALKLRQIVITAVAAACGSSSLMPNNPAVQHVQEYIVTIQKQVSGAIVPIIDQFKNSKDIPTGLKPILDKLGR